MNIITIKTEFNGMPLERADKIVDEWLANMDNPCDEFWEAVRALRDFYENVIDEVNQL